VALSEILVTTKLNPVPLDEACATLNGVGTVTSVVLILVFV